MFDERVEGTVLMIRGATHFDPLRAFGHDLLFEGLHEAGFPNAGLATQQDNCPSPPARLHPPLAQQADFHLSRPTRGERPVLTATSKRLRASLSLPTR